jgi:hypothetical protein
MERSIESGIRAMLSRLAGDIPHPVEGQRRITDEMVASLSQWLVEPAEDEAADVWEWEWTSNGAAFPK